MAHEQERKEQLIAHWTVKGLAEAAPHRSSRRDVNFRLWPFSPSFFFFFRPFFTPSSINWLAGVLGTTLNRSPFLKRLGHGLEDRLCQINPHGRLAGENLCGGGHAWL